METQSTSSASAVLTPDQKPPAKGYWIVNTDIVDEEAHKGYVAANRRIFGQYGAKFLVRWGQKQVMEGPAQRSRQVIIEFRSYQDAIACYHSEEYEAAHKKRGRSRHGRFDDRRGLRRATAGAVSKQRIFQSNNHGDVTLKRTENWSCRI